MCGRYSLSIRAAFVRYQFQQQNMPVDEAADDEETRETYNFAPGYYGLVYRADTADQTQHSPPGSEQDLDQSKTLQVNNKEEKSAKYRLQAMKWGLIPFWTKRNPDYGSLMKTINCRDDSLLDDRGMWTSMKRKKRCVVIAEGFYEWLRKNGGKEKIPHFVKRRDGQLMLFAGLWDSVQYEGSEHVEYTYTIITTDPNKQLSFLHDRMPVILDAGSDALWTWLDPKRTHWTSDLQSILKPFQGELECYAVSKDVGKVGNNSPTFVIPVASSQNKQNIANFFHSPSKVQAPASVKLEPESPTKSKKRSAEDTCPSSPHKSMKLEMPEHITTQSSLTANSTTAGASKARSAISNGMKPKVEEVSSRHGNKKITSFFKKS